MPIAITGSATGSYPSTAIPTHSAGDLIMIFAFLGDNSAVTVPSAGGTVPAWTTITASQGSYGSLKVAYAFATANNHTSGTWFANYITAVVITGAKTSGTIGGYASSQSGTAVDAPAITMSKTDGSSLLLHAFGIYQGTSVTFNSVASGYTVVQDRFTTASQGNLRVIKKDDSTSDGVVSNRVSTGLYGWQGATVEVLAAPATSSFFSMF